MTIMAVAERCESDVSLAEETALFAAIDVKCMTIE